MPENKVIMVNTAQSIRITNDQITELTLTDIPCHDIEADISVTGQDLASFFNIYSDLPGIIITKDGQFFGLLSRKKFYENLSRPFGVEVYLRRPVGEMLDRLNVQILKFPQDYEISRTVQQALARNQDNVYEPILVERDGKYCVVDMYTLLVFMTRSLDNANQIISKQFQLAHQLNKDIEIENVFYSILENTCKIITYDGGMILREEEENWNIVAFKGNLPELLVSKLLMSYKEKLTKIIQYKSRRISSINNFSVPLDSHEEIISIKLSSLIVPLKYSEFNLGAIVLLRIEKDKQYYKYFGALDDFERNPELFIPFQKLDEILFANLESTFSSAIRNTQLVSQIQCLAATDTLTNIMNRRGFFNEARKKFQVSKQQAAGLCILIIDIDHFKSVNDIFGHSMGDDVIRAVVLEIQSCLRETDVLGRYGGDEFIVLLPSDDIPVVTKVADRIRERISDMIIESSKGDILITASIGIGRLDPEINDLDSLIKQADEALLAAKRVGRNQTIICEDGTFYNNGFPLPSARGNGERFKKERIDLPDPYTLNGIDDAALEQTIDDLIEGYVHALELRDKETEGHTQRVARKTVDLAVAMGIEQMMLVNIRRGALLHDIGKIAIPDQILLKPGPLDETEWIVMRKHPIYAYDLLSNNTFLCSCLEIPYNHHERWDGQGYPRKLEGYQIPMAARIFSIVDVWDALTSHRTYRSAWSQEDALAYIREQAGKQFDPQIVPLFLDLVKSRNF